MNYGLEAYTLYETVATQGQYPAVDYDPDAFKLDR